MIVNSVVYDEVGMAGNHPKIMVEVTELYLAITYFDKKGRIVQYYTAYIGIVQPEFELNMAELGYIEGVV